MVESRGFNMFFIYLCLFGYLASSDIQTPSTFKLKIKLTDPQYASQAPVVVLQDPCTLFNNQVCLRDPKYTASQIPQPIEVPISSSSPSLVYEYTGYYTAPITIYVYNPEAFIVKHYTLQNLTGTYTITTMIELYFSGKESTTSSFLISGYLIGPINGTVNFKIYHDDDCMFSIDGTLVYNHTRYAYHYFNYVMVKDQRYLIEILINNSRGGPYAFELNWNISNYRRININYMYLTTRVAGIPYLLSNLKYNIYCDDVSGIRCVACDGLCIDCQDNSSTKICITCKENAHILAGECVCDNNFYLSASNPETCLPCTGLCDTCAEVSSQYKCNSCKLDATLDSTSGTCSCNPGYYLSDINVCVSCEKDTYGLYCPGFCSGNAILVQDKCECIQGYYPSNEDSQECIACEGLCKECNSAECTRCVENAEIRYGKCYCKEGYYTLDKEPNICKICEDNIKVFECLSCPKAYFANPVKYACDPCPLNCERCSNDTECIQCSANYNLQTENNQCLKRCPTGYYGDSINGVCKSCPEYCNSCTSYLRCETCYQNYLKIQEEGSISCIEKCPEHYIIRNDFCECDLINAVFSGDLCIPKEFLLDIKVKDNLISLNFTKQLATNLMPNDIIQTFYNSELEDLISYDLNTIVDLLCYDIVYYALDDIDITLQVNLTLSDTVKDLDGNSLKQSYYYIEVLVHPRESSDSDTGSKNNYLLDKTVKNTSSPARISANICIGVSILSLNLDSTWRFLNTIQIMLYLPLLQVDLPDSMEQDYKDKNDFKSYPDLFYKFNTESPRPYSKAHNFGYSKANLLYNSRKPTLFLVVLILLNIIIELLSKYARGKIKTICSKVSKLFAWNIYLRYFIQMYLELALLSSMNILYVRYT